MTDFTFFLVRPEFLLFGSLLTALSQFSSPQDEPTPAGKFPPSAPAGVIQIQP